MTSRKTRSYKKGRSRKRRKMDKRSKKSHFKMKNVRSRKHVPSKSSRKKRFRVGLTWKSQLGEKVPNIKRDISVNDYVELIGFTTDKSRRFNNKRGCIIEILQNSRYRVMLDEPGFSIKKIKSENLKILNLLGNPCPIGAAEKKKKATGPVGPSAMEEEEDRRAAA